MDVTAADFEPYSTPVEFNVPQGPTITTKDVALNTSTPVEPSVVQGLVTDKDNLPVSGAIITLLDLAGQPAVVIGSGANPVTTGADGRYSFAVAAGSYTVKAQLTGFPDQTASAVTNPTTPATVNFRFTANPGFMQLLASRGIGRPTGDQMFALTAVNARREMIDAISAARYPAPSIDDVVALAALGVDGRYIAEMARAGYRPKTIQSLIEFKALGITPQWIAGFARVGYANVPGDGLVQMRALNITPDFIAGYQRIGYRNLPVNKLVELKALNITPEFVRSVTRASEPMPPVNDLVEIKLFGRKR
jgi:hypothetical protein